MDIFTRINSIELQDILRALWIRFMKKWTNILLYDKWRLTDWWRWDERTGVIKSFSWNGRAEWDRITFVMNYLWCTKWEAISWYEKTFNIEWDKIMNNTNPIQEKWDSLSSVVWEKEIEYLKSRWITNIETLISEWVIKYWGEGLISVPIRSVDGRIKSIQSRNIHSTSNKDRFRIEKNTDANWLFFQNIDTNKKDLYVVEWMFDYLSLRQYTPNVVWLVSASQWLEDIKILSRNHNIIYIPDNDQAWEESLKKMNDLWFKFSWFDLKNYGKKDINELLLYTQEFWVTDILQIIHEDLNKPISSIQLAIEQIKQYWKQFKENNGQLWVSSPYPAIDAKTQWLITWKVYLLMAYSNQGKSKLAYSYVIDMLKKGKRVHFYSLEVDKGMLLANIICAAYNWHFSEVFQKIDEVDTSMFDNLEIYDTIRDLDDIAANVKNDLPYAAFIDFIQNIEGVQGSEYEKMTKIAVDLQKLAIESNVMLFNLSQVNNESRFGAGNTMSPKGSGAIFASSDVIFALYSDNWARKLKIAKNKYWPADITYEVEVDFARGKFNIAEALPDEQNNYNPWRL